MSPADLGLGPYYPFSRRSSTYKSCLSACLHRTWDRVRVLGDESGYGHSGCVNALSWADSILISGGDDRTLHLWRIDPSSSDLDYPYTSSTVIHTGHTANIFNAHMLPRSTRIVSAAGDKQIRVFDIGEEIPRLRSSTEEKTLFSPPINVFRCHEDRVKRIVCEDSPDRFLSVSEDGSVRQHDLRVPHRCRADSVCPGILLQLDHELSTLAMSNLTPYQFVVAGESPYAFLFDRRHLRRANSGVTTCVRRLGRKTAPPTARSFLSGEHITGARMSAYNGHEVLLSYSGDAVYLFSTLDDPGEERHVHSSLVKSSKISAHPPRRNVWHKMAELKPQQQSDEPSEEEEEDDGDDEPEPEPEDDIAQSEEEDQNAYSDVPVIFPRQRYAGARNIETVKDVNFLGPNDELVTSGSDDGNFFVWSKESGGVVGIYEGDSCVVNVIEQHPLLPLVAVSGIDKTVKLFAPKEGPSEFSKIENAAGIIKRNTNPRRSTRIRRLDFATLLATAALASRDEHGAPECTNQ